MAIRFNSNNASTDRMSREMVKATIRGWMAGNANEAGINFFDSLREEIQRPDAEWRANPIIKPQHMMDVLEWPLAKMAKMITVIASAENAKIMMHHIIEYLTNADGHTATTDAIDSYLAEHMSSVYRGDDGEVDDDNVYLQVDRANAIKRLADDDGREPYIFKINAKGAKMGTGRGTFRYTKIALNPKAPSVDSDTFD